MAIRTEEKFIIKEKNKEEQEVFLVINETGSENEPILITTAEELLNIQELADRKSISIPKNTIHYKIIADIDLSETQWISIGTETKPFEGILDGDGHIISNLDYSDSSIINTGLFGCNTGTVANSKIKSSTRVNGNTNTGGLIGSNTGTVTNNTISGIVTGAGNNTGGCIGYILLVYLDI